MFFFDALAELFVVNDLLEEHVAVVDLAEEVDLEFLVALHELAVVVVNLLGHLGHSFKQQLNVLQIKLLIACGERAEHFPDVRF